MPTYYEGVFTPTVTLVGGAGNTTSVYSTNTGRYTRIGNRCFVRILLSGDGGAEGAGSGQITLALPITVSALAPNEYMTAGHFHNAQTEHLAYIQPTPGALTGSLFIQTSATQTTAATGADQNSTTRSIALNFFYEV